MGVEAVLFGGGCGEAGFEVCEGAVAVGEEIGGGLEFGDAGLEVG